MRKFLYLLFIGIFVLTACVPNIILTSAINPLRIIASRASVLPKETVAVALNGELPANYTVTWSAQRGSITKNGSGLAATYVAPDTAGQDVIKAEVGGKSVATIEYTLTVLSPETQTPTASATFTATATLTSSSTPTFAITPTQTSTPTATPTPDPLGIVITEVMVKPCGPDYTDKWNEYIELYNSGDRAINVGGWWISDRLDGGAPDQLVAWDERNQEYNKIFKGNVITDTTAIPPKGFAVILSAIYHLGEQQYKTPYRFPDGTIILTSREGKRIGDDFTGLVGGRGNDFLVLYIGGSTFITKVISTYGSPMNPDNVVEHLRDDFLDNIPFDPAPCQAVERITATGPDAQTNWRMITPGNPGEGNYR